MSLKELNITPSKTRKRAGRGIAAGRGKTAGRGTKGQNSRSGGQRNPGFEGGQNPLFQRIPKSKGFTSKKIKPSIVKTSQINSLKVKNIDLNTLIEKKLVPSSSKRVKLLFDEDVKDSVKVSMDFASSKAIESIEKAGGSFNKVILKPKENVKGTGKSAKKS